MSNIISLSEFRRQRCVSALLEQIGLPGYCQDCDDCGLDYMLTEEGELVPVLPAEPIARSEPAIIIPFERRSQRPAAPARRSARSSSRHL